MNVRLSFREFKIFVFQGGDLVLLWNNLYTKFGSIRSSKRQTPRPSGAGAGHEESKSLKWPYFDLMKYLIPYTSPPEVKSSRDLREGDGHSSSTSASSTMPPLADFAKRQKSSADKLEQQFCNTSQLIEDIILQDMKKNSGKAVSCTPTNISFQENAYLAAVV